MHCTPSPTRHGSSCPPTVPRASRSSSTGQHPCLPHVAWAFYHVSKPSIWAIRFSKMQYFFYESSFIRFCIDGVYVYVLFSCYFIYHVSKPSIWAIRSSKMQYFFYESSFIRFCIDGVYVHVLFSCYFIYFFANRSARKCPWLVSLRTDLLTNLWRWSLRTRMFTNLGDGH